MAQGLYNHSTVPLTREEEELQEMQERANAEAGSSKPSNLNCNEHDDDDDDDDWMQLIYYWNEIQKKKNVQNGIKNSSDTQKTIQSE